MLHGSHTLNKQHSSSYRRLLSSLSWACLVVLAVAAVLDLVAQYASAVLVVARPDLLPDWVLVGAVA